MDRVHPPDRHPSAACNSNSFTVAAAEAPRRNLPRLFARENPELEIHANPQMVIDNQKKNDGKSPF